MSIRRWNLAALEIGTTALILAMVWWYTDASQPSYTVAPMSEILTAFRDAWLFDRVGSDALPSLQRLFLGYGISAVVGIAIGFVLGISELLRMMTQPVVSFLRSIPAVALLPMAIVLFGIGTSMKVFIIAFVCLWPIVLNTTDGVRELDSTMMETARSYGIRGLDRLRFVILPAVSPRIFAGLRMSLSIAVLLLVASEMVASTNGIGFFVFQAQQSFAVADMWAGIILLGILGYVLNTAMMRIERRALRWHVSSHGAKV